MTQEQNEIYHIGIKIFVGHQILYWVVFFAILLVQLNPSSNENKKELRALDYATRVLEFPVLTWAHVIRSNYKEPLTGIEFHYYSFKFTVLLILFNSFCVGVLSSSLIQLAKGKLSSKSTKKQ